MTRIRTVNTFTRDQLIGGADPAPLERIEPIASGQGVLVRGTVLGVETASQKLKVADSAASDGSEVAKFILANEVDTSLGDVPESVYQAGMFNRNYLILGGTDTPEKHEAALREVGIFLTTEQ